MKERKSESCSERDMSSIEYENLCISFKGFVMPPEAFEMPHDNPIRGRYSKKPTFGNVSPR